MQALSSTSVDLYDSKNTIGMDSNNSFTTPLAFCCLSIINIKPITYHWSAFNIRKAIEGIVCTMKRIHFVHKTNKAASFNQNE